MKPNEKEGTYGGQFVGNIFSKHFADRVFNDSWDLLFTSQIQADAVTKLGLTYKPGRIANHCGFFKGAGQKCYFAGHVRRVREGLAGDPARLARFSSPRTFMLKDPKQFAQWEQEARADPQQPWITKVCSAGLSKGVELLRGVRLLEAIDRGVPQEWMVAQEYLHPYMGFGGRKFHLRLYLLVTRWGPPPSLWLFDEGLVFRSSHPYFENRMSTSKDIFSAISNDVEALPLAALWSALDGDPGDAMRPNTSDGSRDGADGSLASAVSQGVRDHINAIIREIFGEAVGRSFGSPPKADGPGGRGFECFDLFGLDVLLDKELRPYVLEVNSGPNLEVDTRGEEHEKLLRELKGLLLEQLASYAAAFARRAESAPAGLSALDLDDLERSMLKNFSHIV